jgi:hypothetical protein
MVILGPDGLARTAPDPLVGTHVFVMNRVPTPDELRDVEKTERVLVNLYDHEHLTAQGLEPSAPIETVQAWALSHGLWPSPRMLVAMAPETMTVEQTARIWADQLDKTFESPGGFSRSPLAGFR